jgi:hypothetical protein
MHKNELSLRSMPALQPAVAHLITSRLWLFQTQCFRLVVLQVLVPGLSFMGHLSGIVAGTLQLYGCLDCIMPSETTLLRMDEWDSLHWLKMTPSFVATTNYSSLPMGATLLSLRGAVSTRLAPIAQRMQSAIPSSQSSVVGGVSGAGRTLGTRSDLQPLVSSQAEDGVPSEASRSPTSHVV